MGKEKPVEESKKGRLGKRSSTGSIDENANPIFPQDQKRRLLKSM